MTAIIFDIDGTLINSMKFDSDLYIRAIKEVLGNVHLHDDWEMYENPTDPGILYQIIQENNVANAEKKAKDVRTRFGDLIATYLKNHPCKPLKGALNALNDISKNPNYTIGFVTGGWGHTAEMKLNSAGFSYNTPIFSGDHHIERINILKSCMRHMCASGNDTVYIGDRIWDLEVALELQVGFIGIGGRLKGKTKTWISDYTDKNWSMSLSKAHLLNRVREQVP